MPISFSMSSEMSTDRVSVSLVLELYAVEEMNENVILFESIRCRAEGAENKTNAANLTNPGL